MVTSLYYTIDNANPIDLYTITASDGTNTVITTFTDAPKVGSVSVSPTNNKRWSECNLHCDSK